MTFAGHSTSFFANCSLSLVVKKSSTVCTPTRFFFFSNLWQRTTERQEVEWPLLVTVNLPVECTGIKRPHFVQLKMAISHSLVVQKSFSPNRWQRTTGRKAAEWHFSRHSTCQCPSSAQESISSFLCDSNWQSFTVQWFRSQIIVRRWFPSSVIGIHSFVLRKQALF